MQLQELIRITNELYYNDSPSWKTIGSIQKELMAFAKPTKDIKKLDYKFYCSYINYLKNRKNSSKTINDKISYSSKILNYAYNNGLIEHKPVLAYQKVKQPDDKFLNKEEKIKILLWCRHNKQNKKVKELLQIILIGLYTGFRINNILSLDPTMYKDNKLYIYDKKVNRYFVMPVSGKIKYIIENFKGFNISYNECYYIFNLMKKDLQLDKAITIHTLRHTFCSDLLQKNVSLPIIRALANHKRIQTTMRYIHLNTTQLEDAINVL